ncbi:MAG: hypothetical protein JKY94_02835 [Rhodobacteraceae bacterium]|nr:hypothetical protein [Paracoccaceae bacterium]
MRQIAMILALWPTYAAAEDWVLLQREAVRAALEGHTIIYVVALGRIFAHPERRFTILDVTVGDIGGCKGISIAACGRLRIYRCVMTSKWQVLG